MKAKIKTAADILMTAALPVLMCYSIVGETAHELIGIVMFCLLILHHVLNFGSVKSLFKGKYPPKRIIGTTVNVLIFVCMIGLMGSSLVISKHVFAFLHLGGAGLARSVHLLCAYWGLVFMSVHLGMHVPQILTRIGWKQKAPGWLRILSGIVALLGVISFVRLKVADYLFARAQFVFLDTAAPAWLTCLQYLSIVILFAVAGYLVSLVRWTGRKDREGGSV